MKLDENRNIEWSLYHDQLTSPALTSADNIVSITVVTSSWEQIIFFGVSDLSPWLAGFLLVFFFLPNRCFSVLMYLECFPLKWYYKILNLEKLLDFYSTDS